MHGNNPGGVKDPKVKAKRAGEELAGLFSKALSGELPFDPSAPPSDKSDEIGMRIIFQLVQLYLLAEGELPDLLRRFVAAVSNKTDPLRQGIPPELWAAIWPQINILKNGRNSFERAREEGRRIENTGAGKHLGVGVVGLGAPGEGGK